MSGTLGNLVQRNPRAELASALTASHARHRGARCTRTGPLPLLPSGPGGIGGIASRGSRYLTFDCNKRVSNGLRDPRFWQRYNVQTSLYLLVLSGFMLLASTGRLDIPSMLVSIVALSTRGIFLIRERDFAIPE